MILVTSDLHLTDRRWDEYRWSLFPWIKAQIEPHEITSVWILGDLTDKKDRHPSRLVNKIVKELRLLGEMMPDGVHVTMGNHDYDDPAVPFFRNTLPLIPGVSFYRQLTWTEVCGLKVAFAPHTHTPRKHWYMPTESGNGSGSGRRPDWADTDVACFHQTFKGAKASNGFLMEGTGQAWRRLGMNPRAQILSGDIHVPQTLGRVTYCGSPYPVAFGDHFKPRVLLVNPKHPRRVQSLPRTTIRRAVVTLESVDELDEIDASTEDQFKIVFHLTRSQLSEWKDLQRATRHWARKERVHLRSVEMREKKGVLPTFGKKTRLEANRRLDEFDMLSRYAKAQELDAPTTKAGRKLLKAVKK